MQFYSSESAIIQDILIDLEPEFVALRTQYEVATVLYRDYTGAGFIIGLEVPKATLPTLVHNKRLTTYFVLKELEFGAEGMLVVLEGYMAYLELISLYGTFPPNLETLTIEGFPKQREGT